MHGFPSQGEAVAKISEDGQPEVEVKHYEAGGYFGEIALLANVPRKVSQSVSLIINSFPFSLLIHAVSPHLYLSPPSQLK